MAFKAAHSRNPKEAERALTEKVFEEIEHLLILPPSDEEGYEKALQRWNLNKGRFPDLMEQFRADQRVIAGQQPLPEAAGSPAVLDAKKKRGWKLAGYALSLPGLVLHLPAILVALAWERVVVKDVHLIPAARFAAGVLLVPPWYLMALGLLHVQARSLPLDLLLLILMPLSLWIWSRSWHWTRERF